MTRKLTKAQVVALCRMTFREYPDQFPRGDVIAKREFFNDYTDSLCKEGDITLKQYESWSNPF